MSEPISTIPPNVVYTDEEAGQPGPCTIAVYVFPQRRAVSIIAYGNGGVELTFRQARWLAEALLRLLARGKNDIIRLDAGQADSVLLRLGAYSVTIASGIQRVLFLREHAGPIARALLAQLEEEQ